VPGPTAETARNEKKIQPPEMRATVTFNLCRLINFQLRGTKMELNKRISEICYFLDGEKNESKQFFLTVEKKY